MRVLLVNTSDSAGGAAIAARRLLSALNNHGVQATMLVRDKLTDHLRIKQLPPSPLLRAKFALERAEIFATNGFSRENLFAVDHATHGYDITHLPEFEQADVIHLHWINQGMLSLSDIRKVLTSGKRIVWTLHDMWPCTGVCHQSAGCEGWLQECGNCPQLRGGGSEKDLSHTTFLRKQKTYAAGHIHFVACSDWLADIARRAPLLKGHDVASIPNPIDMNFFRPGSQQEARQKLGLPQDKKLILFVAFNATDRRKGIDYLKESVEILKKQYGKLIDSIAVVPVGRDAEALRGQFACEVLPQPYVTDETTMRLLYNAADALAMPTLMDNLPNTIVEAMACGLPCVGFNVGGLPQMIDHGVNGYLAQLKDAADFAQGLTHILFSEHGGSFVQAARRKAERHYSEQAVATQYIKIYEQG
ncbi:MAG: glycosyltransferase family 4 protein [Bacteroidaceae bacterium]|nr:glycosyltransferase family 4 protein [Bacteroidaceae bacterium]